MASRKILIALVAVTLVTVGIGAATAEVPLSSHQDGPDDGTATALDGDDDNETVQTIDGTLTAGADGQYLLDGYHVGIGPPGYVNDTESPADFDGDGTGETIAAEFDGLVGGNVTITAEVDGQEADVLAVDGVQYRERGQPPWAGPPEDAGPPDDPGNSTGPPADAGPPEDAGPPDDPGNSTGPPADAGPPEDAGPPDDPGNSPGPPENPGNDS